MRSLPAFLLAGLLATVVTTCGERVSVSAQFRTETWLKGAQFLHHRVKGRYGSLEEILRVEIETEQLRTNYLKPESDWFRVKVGPALGGTSYEEGWHAFIWPGYPETMEDAMRWAGAGGTPATWLVSVRGDPDSGKLERFYSVHVGYLGNPVGPMPGDGLLDETGAPLPGKWHREGDYDSVAYEWSDETRAVDAAADRRAVAGLVLGLLGGVLAGFLLGWGAPSYLLPIGAAAVAPLPFLYGSLYLGLGTLAAYVVGALGGATVRHERGWLAQVGVALFLGVALAAFFWIWPLHRIEVRVQTVLDAVRARAASEP